MQSDPAALDLRPWGYAPGGYVFRCKDCTPSGAQILDRPVGDKRSWRCEPCARKAMAASKQSDPAAAGVSLVWATPDADALVAYMARVSAPENQANAETAPRLISYLIRNRHWSPFEMVSLCMEVNTTRDIGRQLLRHRSFVFQEFSQRYAAVDALPEAPLREARMQDPKNRQASVPCKDDWTARWWQAAQTVHQRDAVDLYQGAIARGIAKEVARAVLPEGLTASRLYMAGTVRSWLHFCDVRRGNGTQLETQRIADAAWLVMQAACPAICQAWEQQTNGQISKTKGVNQ